MCERAVADVLHEMVCGYERRHPEPLRALAAHLGDPGDIADLFRIHQQHHCVTADSAADERAGAHLGRAVVWTSRTEIRRAHRKGEVNPGTRPTRVVLIEPRLRGVDVMVSCQACREAESDCVDVEFAETREQRRTVLMNLSDDARGPRMAIQHVAHHGFDEVALLLDDDHLVESTGGGIGDEALEDLAVERVDHAEFEDADTGPL